MEGIWGEAGLLWRNTLFFPSITTLGGRFKDSFGPGSSFLPPLSCPQLPDKGSKGQRTSALTGMCCLPRAPSQKKKSCPHHPSGPLNGNGGTPQSLVLSPHLHLIQWKVGVLPLEDGAPHLPTSLYQVSSYLLAIWIVKSNLGM